MLLANILPRVFLHTENGQEIRLTDPNQHFSVDAVLNFYSGTYGVDHGQDQRPRHQKR